MQKPWQPSQHGRYVHGQNEQHELYTIYRGKDPTQPIASVVWQFIKDEACSNPAMLSRSILTRSTIRI